MLTSAEWRKQLNTKIPNNFKLESYSKQSVDSTFKNGIYELLTEIQEKNIMYEDFQGS